MILRRRRREESLTTSRELLGKSPPLFIRGANLRFSYIYSTVVHVIDGLITKAI